MHLAPCALGKQPKLQLAHQQHSQWLYLCGNQSLIDSALTFIPSKMPQRS